MGRRAGALRPATSRAVRRERVWRDGRTEGLSLLRASYVEQRFSLHRQETYVIGTNLRGSASCFGAGEPEIVPGALGVIPPGVAHGGYRTGSEPWVYAAAYPTHELLLELQREITGRDAPTIGFSRFLYPDAELVRAFLRAHAAGIDGDDPLAAESMLLDALGMLLERYANGHRRRPGALLAPVERSREYIEEHLCDSLSLGEIAAASGYTRFHFLRLFKAQTGETPHAYLMRRRVECAQSQLRRGRPIADAAFACGFSDQAHLTRRFRQLVGVTPGEFVRGSRVAAPRDL